MKFPWRCAATLLVLVLCVAHAGAREAVGDVSETDPLTGMSTNPEDWFTPSTPRNVESTHDLAGDLAERYYVRREEAGGVCPGTYVLRTYPQPLAVETEDQLIIAEADALSSVVGAEAVLTGNVSVEQGNRLLLAPKAELDQQTQIARFPDGVRMDQPGLVVQGSEATVQMDSDEARVEGVQFLLTEPSIRGGSTVLVQNEAGDLRLDNNRFTRCEPANNGWRLDTKSLLIEKDAVFGSARHAVLRMKSVPVFYSPRLSFPVTDERVSGFLFPNFAYSDEDGFDFSIPYYLNLAPNYDATFVPRYISRRGVGAELQFRHLSSWQSTILSGAYLPKDDLYDGKLQRDDYDDLGGEPVFGAFHPADRWLGAVDHQGRIGPFSTVIDYTSVSDRDYFRDLGSDLGVSSQIELERRGEVRFNQGNLSARLWAQRFQRLDDRLLDDYERLPEMDIAYAADLWGPLRLSMDARWADFDRDTQNAVGLAAITGARTHLEPRLSLPLSWPFGFLTMTAGYRYTVYDLEQDSSASGLQLVEETPERKIGLGSIDGGLFFERDLEWFDTGLTQTLEPRLYYLRQSFEDQSNLPLFDVSQLTFGYSQLFRSNRFAGLDRIGDANQLSAGITTRFLSRSTGVEHFRFSLGEIFYFEDRQVTLSGVPGPEEQQSSSAIAAEASARLAGNWRLNGSLVWDPHDDEVDEGGVGLQYRRDNRHIFNIGFRKRVSENIEQTDVSFVWPISDHFALLGRWNYDLVSGRTIEGFGGIEYSDCCLQVRLMARHFLDSRGSGIVNFENVEADDGIFLQIVFKGLAGFGTQVESALERGIRGYRTPEQQDYLSGRN